MDGAADADRLPPGEPLQDHLVGVDLEPASANRSSHFRSSSLPSISVPQELSPGNLNRTSSASIRSAGSRSPSRDLAMLREIISLPSQDSIPGT